MEAKKRTKQPASFAVRKKEIKNLRNQAALHFLAAMISNPQSQKWTNAEMVHDSVMLADLIVSALNTNK